MLDFGGVSVKSEPYFLGNFGPLLSFEEKDPLDLCFCGGQCGFTSIWSTFSKVSRQWLGEICCTTRVAWFGYPNRLFPKKICPDICAVYQSHIIGMYSRYVVCDPHFPNMFPFILGDLDRSGAAMGKKYWSLPFVIPGQADGTVQGLLCFYIYICIYLYI